MRPIALALFALSLAACSKSNEVDIDNSTSVGLQCSGADDCGTSGVCALGFCRIGCDSDGQCPPGSLCVGDRAPYGCQLPQDLACSSAKPCAAGLTCGLDGKCRIACDASKACPRAEQRCLGGGCVTVTESDFSKWSCPNSDNTQANPEDRACRSEDGGTASTSLWGCNPKGATQPGWSKLAECSSAFSCDGAAAAGASACVCVPKDASCNNAILKVCNDTGSAFLSDTQCSGETPHCDLAGKKCFKLDIDPSEVTRAQYKAFLDGNPSAENLPQGCKWKASEALKFTPQYSWPPSAAEENLPVFVDWCDAYAYCRSKGRRLCGKIGGGALQDKEAFDATKSQWYAACTSSGQFIYPYGDQFKYALCSDSAFAAVGSKPGCHSTVPGYEGVLDLSGNAGEWEDACDLDVSAPAASRTDKCRVRGGIASAEDATNHPEKLACTAATEFSQRDLRVEGVGFRCCGD